MPRAFFWRRLHSLLGLWLVIFLIEHLLTNSQAALFIGDDGQGFIHAVNFLHSLPYLPVIETVLLGGPIVFHAVWGIKYIFTAKANSGKSDGSKPSLGEYTRNRAYTWQRISSWVLIVGIIIHVVQMRFVNFPATADKDGEHYFMVRVTLDEGLYTVADRLGVELYDQVRINDAKKGLSQRRFSSEAKRIEVNEATLGLLWSPEGVAYNSEQAKRLQQQQRGQQQLEWVNALEQRPLRGGDVIAVSNEFGKAVLLMVRDTFKIPYMIVLYSVFVILAVFHAFNGLWTFLITWGLILTQASQIIMRRLSLGLMLLLGSLGLAAAWMTYWINLRL